MNLKFRFRNIFLREALKHRITFTVAVQTLSENRLQRKCQCEKVYANVTPLTVASYLPESE